MEKAIPMSSTVLHRRRNGIYYTPLTAAQVMARWAVRSETDRVLEPCFGEGVFLSALKEMNAGQVHGVELMDATYQSAVESGLVNADESILGNFLDVDPFEIDVAIGNPPYVRLRSLPEGHKERANKAAEKALGGPMDAAGSLWMPFLLHATRFLVRGGRLAFVLPYEITHVRYAKVLWKFLGENFGDLRLVRVKERIFSDLMQEVVILFAGNWGGSTRSVCFEAYRRTSDLDAGQPAVRKELAIQAVIEDRPFTRALLNSDADSLLQERSLHLTAPIPEFCTFNIGYVSGNKRFFHPDVGTVTKFGLPSESLRRSIVASRELSKVGVRTSAIDRDTLKRLFYPNGHLSEQERQYVLQGENEGIDTGYKCNKRKPWYKVPDVRVPDVLLSVFREVPALVENDANLVASNSILCGFLRNGHTAKQFVAAWYTSLTLLSCELRVHSLGGGVLCLIPGEVANLRIPAPDTLPVGHIADVDEALQRNENPYLTGDAPILVGALGLSRQEVSYIHEGIHTLASWRTAYKDQRA